MQSPPFNDYLGIQVQRREDGRGVAVLDLAPHHLNRRGVAHGGVVTALLDSALGAAVISAIPKEWWCSTTSLHTQFIGGAAAGRLTATGHLSRRGAKIAFAAGEIRDAADNLIATAQGTWHLWDHRPPRRRVAQTTRGRAVLRGSGEALRVGKIVAVGRNYADHIVEMGAPEGSPPVVFLKPPSALASAPASLVLPVSAGRVHHEVELVAVIGTEGKSIPRASALDHVLGYAVGLDLTLRDVQSAAKKSGDPWTLSKGFDGSAPISHVAPASEVGQPSRLEISLEVNGERRQHGNTGQMLHGVADLVVHVSEWMTLERGDLLFTGTPAGVGPLQAGDRIVARIERVGELDITLEAEQ